MPEQQKKLGLGSLTCIVVGSIIGGGAFALPQTITQVAQTGAILIAWLITTLGMIGLAFTFYQLNALRPDLKGGIYSYAKTGFGHFVGFISAWGYWLSAWIGNVSYAVLMFSAIGFFFPQFGAGNTLWSVIAASCFLWAIHFLILKGMKEAAIINIITTIAKLIPIIIFIVICLFAFQEHNFTMDFWGKNIGHVLPQIKDTMLVTLWVFIGIEGAVVVSGRARKAKDVGLATVFGLVVTASVYILITILSIGVLGQPQLSTLSNPSMAYVLSTVVGHWGAVLVNIGLIISLAGAWLGWTILCAELPQVAAKDHVLPAFLAKNNVNKSPANALWLSNGLIQLFLIVVYFSESTYLNLLKLATSCILLPYFFSGLFALKLIFFGQEYYGQKKLKYKNLIFALLGTIYAAFLVFAAGLHFLLLSTILYLIGMPLYVWARVKAGNRVFTPLEWVLFLGICAAAGYGLFPHIMKI